MSLDRGRKISLEGSTISGSSGGGKLTLGMLRKLVAEHKLPVEKFVTHTFSFDDILDAHDIFGHAAEHDSLKVLIH
ncbi:MAG: hypothetical protein EPN30_09965 [Actinomycetota bacterium]|nr:MAG: hypothetical protein EPN30_09965 [Actinomycetota bacterium]